jgi:glycosyltransferase involved in cell wall biosynthesis
MMAQVKVGIALAAYKPAPEVFEEQLKSIQDQTYPHWVCIITFDSSLEETLSSPKISIFKKDPRFVWLENPIRLGHKKNFERAIQESLRHSVDAIACSDQDDVWYPNKISECVQALQAQGPLSLVHSDMHVLEDGKILDGTAWRIENRGITNCKSRHFYVRNIVAGCSMIFDAELARKFPIIPDEAEYHDHWYALVAAYHGGISAVNLPLYAYRQHRNNEVGVSPFQNIFAVPEGSTPSSIFNKCKNGWLKSYRLASAAKRHGLPLRWFEKLIFLLPFDLGLGLILLGLLNWFKDPALTRACLARGAGKALSFPNPTRDLTSPKRKKVPLTPGG